MPTDQQAAFFFAGVEVAVQAVFFDVDVDLDLDAATVKDLLADAQQTDVLELVCADVCTALYADAEPDLIITEIDPACSLGIDGDPDGDPAAIIGNLRCEGYPSATVCVGGRRPLGHIELPLPAADLPTYLAHCARLEAASVLAFDQLAARLELWNAPQPLIDRCRAAALEEATHATLLGDLARTAGGQPGTPEPAAVAERGAGAAVRREDGRGPAPPGGRRRGAESEPGEQAGHTLRNGIDAAIVLAIVLSIVGIGYQREYSAQATVASLGAHVKTRASVLRDGHVQPLPVEAVVPGDVVLLSAGIIVVAIVLIVAPTPVEGIIRNLAARGNQLLQQPGSRKT
mgnify:CR=1 FL=1